MLTNDCFFLSIILSCLTTKEDAKSGRPVYLYNEDERQLIMAAIVNGIIDIKEINLPISGMYRTVFVFKGFYFIFIGRPILYLAQKRKNIAENSRLAEIDIDVDEQSKNRTS